jgi:hypothetical protein
MSEEIESFAHSANCAGRPEPLRDHLVAVVERASKYAAIFGAGDEARFAGLLHDLGKYGDLFQRRLRGEVGGIDHWTPGAVAALHEGRAASIASKRRFSEPGIDYTGYHLASVRMLWWIETTYPSCVQQKSGSAESAVPLFH